MKPPKTLFLTWVASAGYQVGYYEQYNTMQEAVGSHGGEAFVYEATIRPVGKFKAVTELEPVKELKPKTKRKKAKR